MSTKRCAARLIAEASPGQAGEEKERHAVKSPHARRCPHRLTGRSAAPPASRREGRRARERRRRAVALTSSRLPPRRAEPRTERSGHKRGVRSRRRDTQPLKHDAGRRCTQQDEAMRDCTDDRKSRCAPHFRLVGTTTVSGVVPLQRVRRQADDVTLRMLLRCAALCETLSVTEEAEAGTDCALTASTVLPTRGAVLLTGVRQLS